MRTSPVPEASATAMHVDTAQAPTGVKPEAAAIRPISDSAIWSRLRPVCVLLTSHPRVAAGAPPLSRAYESGSARRADSAQPAARPAGHWRQIAAVGPREAFIT